MGVCSAHARVSRTSPVTVHTNPHEATSQRTKGTGLMSTGEGTQDRLLPYRTYSTRGRNCKTTGHLCAATTHRVDIECGGPKCQAPSLDQGLGPTQWMLRESRWACYSLFDDFMTDGDTISAIQIERNGVVQKGAEAVRKRASHRLRIRIPFHTPVPGSPLGTSPCLIRARLAV